MTEVHKLFSDAACGAFERIAENNAEYMAVELEKIELVNRLKDKLDKDTFKEVKALMDCYESQNHIMTMEFCLLRVLDLYQTS